MGIHNSTPQPLSSTAQLMDLRYGQVVQIGGVISKLMPKVSKAGKHPQPGRDIDLLMLKDQAGEIEVLAFRDTFASCSPPLQVGVSIIVIGAVYFVSRPKIFADQVIVLSEAPQSDDNANKNPAP